MQGQNIGQKLHYDFRSAGLISHVQMVQEAIPNGFHVLKTLGGSVVEERGQI